MRTKVILAAALLGAVSVTPVSAQVILDMSLITCKQFLESPPDRKDLIASWMSGYFSASKNLYLIDFRYVERNEKVVGNYCRKHKAETLMSAVLENAR
jgi:acid stress chaperone HdeB